MSTLRVFATRKAAAPRILIPKSHLLYRELYISRIYSSLNVADIAMLLFPTTRLSGGECAGCRDNSSSGDLLRVSLVSTGSFSNFVAQRIGFPARIARKLLLQQKRGL